MADFDINTLISEVTDEADTSTTVRIAEGQVSQAKGKSGAIA